MCAVRLLFLALDLRLEQDQAECIHVREIVTNIAGLGHDVLVLISRRSSWRGDDASPRLRVRAVGGGKTAFELIRVLREAKRFRPEVVYERRFLPKMSAALSMIQRIPAVVEINGLVDQEQEMQGRSHKYLLPTTLLRGLHAIVFSRMAKVVAVTGRLAREMSARYRISLDRLAVVENAANVRLFHPMDKVACRREIGLSSDRDWLCFEGGLYPWHDVPTALRAVRVLKEQGFRIGLFIVGEGPCRLQFEALSVSLGLDQEVRFLGGVPYERVPVFIGACDIGVGPFTSSRNVEIGLSPMKIYEYVACGRPVVSSRLPGIAEWIEAENVGRLAEPDNPEDFAATLADMLHDHEFQREMVVRGPLAVARGHSWDSVAARLTVLCQELAAG